MMTVKILLKDLVLLMALAVLATMITNGASLILVIIHYLGVIR